MIPRPVHTLTLLAILVLLPTLLPASESVGPPELKDILWDMGVKVLDVAIVAFFAFKFLSKPLSRLVESRSEGIRRTLEDATRGRLEAEAKLKALQEKAEQIDTEIEAMRNQTRLEIEREQHLLLEEARRASEHVSRHARDTLHQEVAKAREELYREAVRLSTGLAEEMIARDFSDRDRQRMLRDYLREMETSR